MIFSLLGLEVFTSFLSAIKLLLQNKKGQDAMILVLDLGQNSSQTDILQRITGRAKLFIQGQDMLPMATTFWATLTKSRGTKMKNAHTLEDHMEQTAR